VRLRESANVIAPIRARALNASFAQQSRAANLCANLILRLRIRARQVTNGHIVMDTMVLRRLCAMRAYARDAAFVEFAQSTKKIWRALMHIAQLIL
jgi:nitrate reductase beta subunit